MLRKAEKRNAAFELQKEKEEKRIQLEREMAVQANAEFFEEDEPAKAEQDMDPDFEAPSQTPDVPQTRNLHPLPRTAATCDRRNISDEAADLSPNSANLRPNLANLSPYLANLSPNLANLRPI